MRKRQPIPIVALLLAWLVPGAGHAYIGRLTRGIIIFVAISATFWAGVAMGGVMTVDHRQERWWFVAQMFTGVHGLVSWQRQQKVQAWLDNDKYVNQWIPRAEKNPAQLRQARIDKRLADENLALVGPTENFARAYTGVAGLLSLMCIFDATILALMGVTGEKMPHPPSKPQ
ncbi:MAG: hypothetical protein KAU28_01465 [Phycisphaerae bacterium]|nr:hypothetical protein [Phycisphaerae bacterium]